MKDYETRKTENGVRLQWELVTDPEVRKLLTLEQMLTVFRRTLRPEKFTCQESGMEMENADALLIGHSGEATCRAYTGEWLREGVQGSFYLDDAVENNPDGTVSAAFLWWELAEEDERAAEWFGELAKALDEAQENLLLFGRI